MVFNKHLKETVEGEEETLAEQSFTEETLKLWLCLL